MMYSLLLTCLSTMLILQSQPLSVALMTLKPTAPVFTRAVLRSQDGFARLESVIGTMPRLSAPSSRTRAEVKKRNLLQTKTLLRRLLPPLTWPTEKSALTRSQLIAGLLESRWKTKQTPPTSNLISSATTRTLTMSKWPVVRTDLLEIKHSQMVETVRRMVREGLPTKMAVRLSTERVSGLKREEMAEDLPIPPDPMVKKSRLLLRKSKLLTPSTVTTSQPR